MNFRSLRFMMQAFVNPGRIEKLEVESFNLRDAFPLVVAFSRLLWLFVYSCINKILSESARGKLGTLGILRLAGVFVCDLLVCLFAICWYMFAMIEESFVLEIDLVWFCEQDLVLRTGFGFVK